MKTAAIRQMFLDQVRSLEQTAHDIRRFEELGHGQLAPASYYSSRAFYLNAATIAFSKLPTGQARAQIARPPRRGDDMTGGGLYVGQAPGGVLWVSYEGSADFAQMCRTFDSQFGDAPRRRSVAA